MEICVGRYDPANKFAGNKCTKSAYADSPPTVISLLPGVKSTQVDFVPLLPAVSTAGPNPPQSFQRRESWLICHFSRGPDSTRNSKVAMYPSRVWRREANSMRA